MQPLKFIAVSLLLIASLGASAHADATPPSKAGASSTTPADSPAPSAMPEFKSGAYLTAGYGVGAHNQNDGTNGYSLGTTGFTFALGYNFLPQFQMGAYIGSSVNPLALFQSGDSTNIDVFALEALYSPLGGSGLFLGAKGGFELADTWHSDNNGYFSYANGWVAGPALGYEFKIERRLTFGLEGDYLIATTNVIPSLGLFEGFFKVRF